MTCPISFFSHTTVLRLLTHKSVAHPLKIDNNINIRSMFYNHIQSYD